MDVSPGAPEFVEDLGGGLVRRWSTAADQEKIGYCLAEAFRRSADDPVDQRMINRAVTMFSRGFPHMGPGDYAVVEDISLPERPIVACASLWHQRWSLGGIPLDAGRPEYVGTMPEYRNRGLVRAVFEMLHARSSARGDHLQIIFGIPHYYRQFGYEYAADIYGERAVYTALIPPVEAGTTDRYRLRPAGVEDVPHLKALYDQNRSASLAWAEVSEAEWSYYITAWEDPLLRSLEPGAPGLARRLYMVVDGSDTDSDRVFGFACVASRRRDQKLDVHFLQLYPFVNWRAAMPSLLRSLHTAAEETPAAKGDTAPVRALKLALGRAHPAYEVVSEKLAPVYEDPYAWYIRVTNAADFVRHIRPLLERRLASSILTGHSGELIVDFYRGGLRLEFDSGHLAAAKPWRPPDYGYHAHAGCPADVLQQLMFGYRSLAELRAIYPDVWAGEEAALLIDILFPKQPSTVWMHGYT
ncbi:MAG: GNAT family N-acetyltransferase [Caldilineaceae bacterium]